jgi:hypothetical protein
LQVTGYKSQVEKLKSWKIGRLQITGAFWAEIEDAAPGGIAQNTLTAACHCPLFSDL